MKLEDDVKDQPVRVLLVDEDEDNYIIIRDLLAQAEVSGFYLEWVTTYASGLEAIGQHEHDIYLIDYRLGERTGIELLREALKNGSGSPIILLTGQGDHKIDLQAMEAGAADYLVKGQMETSILERSIRYAIERYRTLEALRSSEAANRVLLAETQKRLKEQIALREAGTIISSTLDLKAVLTRIAEQMAKAINATSAYINSYDQATGSTTVIADYISPNACPEEQVSDLGVTYVAHDLITKGILQFGGHEICHEDSPRIAEAERAHMRTYGAKSILYVPLWMKDEPIGYLELWESRRRREFTPDEIEVCEGIASQAAVALENARLYQQAQQEIEERKRAEGQIRASLREKEVLLQEIHHRVKNNLQIISSVLKLQAGFVTNQQALAILRNSQNRIRSMALIHEKLYQTEDLSEINLAEYIRDLASYLFGSYRSSLQAPVELKIRAEPVLLEIESAVPCGLILNELVCNALEHGFRSNRDRPDDQTAEIRIELRQEDSQLSLIVSDNGIGLPSSDLGELTTQSLGLQLVSVLVGQLGGTLEICMQGGTQFKITFAIP
jgi:two-component sensor histidine kinase/FixJ family two-component response regulator